jgi:pimeloyl-ACP methyl ester carboxylesterase
VFAPPLLTTTPGAAGEAVPDDEDTELDGEPDEALSVAAVAAEVASSLGVVELGADELGVDELTDDSDPDGSDESADGSAAATPDITTAKIPAAVANDIAVAPIRATCAGADIPIWIVGGRRPRIPFVESRSGQRILSTVPHPRNRHDRRNVSIENVAATVRSARAIRVSYSLLLPVSPPVLLLELLLELVRFPPRAFLMPSPKFLAAAPT